MTQPVESQFRVMRWEHAACPDHPHKVDHHLDTFGVCPLVDRRINFLDLAGRKIESDPRPETHGLFMRQSFAAERFSFGKDLCEEPHRLKKFKTVRLVKQFLI